MAQNDIMQITEKVSIQSIGKNTYQQDVSNKKFNSFYHWFIYKTSYVHFSKFHRDKKLSGLFAFCYILIRFRLKAYFKFI